MRITSLLLLALVAAGCKARSETTVATTPAEPAAPAATAPAPEAVAEIGVAECDEFLRKWDKCLATKITGEAHDQVEVGLEATRESWKRAAATPETKAGLEAVIGRLRSRAGIDGVILGGTELSLILREETIAGVSVLDTTRIHVEAIVARMLA